MRTLRVYATIARILLSYGLLRLRRPFVSPERYAEALDRRHVANARRLLRAILRAGGLFIKVGQLISILTNFLPVAFRQELEGLQDRLPPRPYDEIADRIRAELGDSPETLFAEFDKNPIATASLAQVHAATLHDGRRVAVKVQHRDIDEVAQHDLATIRRILRIVQYFTGVRGLESYHPEISRMIAEELDFGAEARNIATIGANFAGDTSVRVPVVIPDRSSSRVLTTLFINGTKITDFPALAARGLERRTLASRVVGAYCRMIFVDGIYHADPHPGNIFVGEDGALVFVDFGAVGRLAPHMREGIPRFFEGVIRQNPEMITNAISTMGFVARDADSATIAKKVIAYFQRRFFQEMTEDSWGLGDLQVDMRSRLETLADLRKLDVSFRQLTTTFQVPKDWVLLERTLLLLLGLCTELDASWNPMTVIRPYLEDVVLGEKKDWPELLRGALTEMARKAITLPEDMQQALGRVNRGEFEVRVPEITEAARFVYAGVHQLIYCILATASGLIAYQAYDAGRVLISRILTVTAIAAIIGLFVSMRSADRRRP